MNTLTIKLPPQLEHEVVAVSNQEKVSKSELVRRAITFYLAQHDKPSQTPSALSQVSDLVGCFAGGPNDLASNPARFSDFGRV